MITDIASVIFVCVTANHLGLVSAIEDVAGRSIPVLNCPKCLTFWTTAILCFFTHGMNIQVTLAVSLLASYTAIWLELAEGFIDILYIKLYGKIDKTDTDAEAAASAKDGGTESRVPVLPQERQEGKD